MIYLDISYNELFCSKECAKRNASDNGDPFSPNRLVPIYPSDYREMQCYSNVCVCGKAMDLTPEAPRPAVKKWE